MKWLIRLLPLTALVLGAVWFGLSRLTPEVVLGESESGTAVDAVTGTAEIFAFSDLKLKAEQRGVIKEIHVKGGEQVKEGDWLVTQEAEDLDLRIAQTKIRLQAARDQAEVLSPLKLDLEAIREELEAARLAVEMQQAPESRIEAVEREREKKEIYLSLEAIRNREQIDVLENQLAQLQLQREEMLTKAPFDGEVVAIYVFRGDLINSGQNLLRLVSPQVLGQLELAEDDFAGVAVGQPVTLRLAGLPGQRIEAEVDRLEAVADPESKTRKVFLKFSEEAQADLVDGMTGEGYLIKNERPGSVLIPRRALLGNRLFVYENGHVGLRTVKPGYLSLRTAEIREGLEPGEKVVLEGQHLLRDGDKVKVRSAE